MREGIVDRLWDRLTRFAQRLGRSRWRVAVGLVVAGLVVAAAAAVVVSGRFDAPQGPTADDVAVGAETEFELDAGELDAAARTVVIDAALEALEDRYVFPDVAAEIAQAIRARQRRGDYDAMQFKRAFARQLTEDLQQVSNDQHLWVDVDYLPPSLEPPAPPPWGIEQARRLDGNVGLIPIRGFPPPDPQLRQALAEAMQTVHSTEALIFDLRNNDGGHPDMTVLVASYLFGPERMRFTSFHDRDGLAEETFTSVELQGPRYGADKPVYVLTSDRTFSGGEEFAYNLKHFGRATIVGETTAGGAHPTEPVELSAHLVMFVPSARPVHPVTGTNWEGSGVEPDIAVPAETALEVALRRATP